MRTHYPLCVLIETHVLPSKYIERRNGNGATSKGQIARTGGRIGPSRRAGRTGKTTIIQCGRRRFDIISNQFLALEEQFEACLDELQEAKPAQCIENMGQMI